MNLYGKHAEDKSLHKTDFLGKQLALRQAYVSGKDKRSNSSIGNPNQI